MCKTAADKVLEANVCFNTYKLNRAFARFYQSIFAESGLTYPKYIILTVLAESGPQSITELSERAGVETNTLSPLLKRMANFGVITRERDLSDERRMVLNITELGSVARELAKDAAESAFADLGLSANEVSQVIELMTTVQERLAAAEPAPMDAASITSQRK